MSASSFLILGPYILGRGSLELPWPIMSLSVFGYTALYSAVKYLLTAPGFKLNRLVPWRLCVLVHRFFDRLIDMDSSEGVIGAKLDLKPPLHDFSVHIWVRRV